MTRVLTAIERNRGRIWAVCYRMTGLRAEADELSQEAMARAIERSSQVKEVDPTGWLLRLTTSLCIDHLRHRTVQRRIAELVDPLREESVIDVSARAPDNTAILREDVRFAVVVALQQLTPQQRAVLILHDVCDQPLTEVAEVLETNANAAKALLHRARVALTKARVHDDVDVPVDRAVVEKLARAIESGDVNALAVLLRDDVWGIVDGGGIVQTSTRPAFGKQAVSRQWANAKRRLGVLVKTHVVLLNGEAAIIIRAAPVPELVIAIVHLETRNGQVLALRVSRDPRKVAHLPRTL